MNAPCPEPIEEDTLVDYWAGDLDEPLSARVEDHLFACGDCAERLAAIASLTGGIATLARAGWLEGIVSRGVMNRLAHDGVRVRCYSLAPGESVSGTAWPDDDLLVIGLRANFDGVEMLSLLVTGPGNIEMGRIQQVPVPRRGSELFWATPGVAIRRMPAMRIRLTLRGEGAGRPVLGEYVLDYSAAQPYG